MSYEFAALPVCNFILLRIFPCILLVHICPELGLILFSLAQFCLHKRQELLGFIRSSGSGHGVIKVINKIIVHVLDFFQYDIDVISHYGSAPVCPVSNSPHLPVRHESTPSMWCLNMNSHSL